ncbi:MAG: hypothetical protein HRT57_08480 [Crocinitomicaceae bacterium]|nr:hypothetical protein [Crocinitomicaceae bacterium]
MKLFASITVVFLLISGCAKKNTDKYGIYLQENITEIQSDQVTIHLFHKIPRNVLNVQKKVYFGTEPSGDNPLIIDYNVLEHTDGIFVPEDHIISDLFGNETYYIKASLRSMPNDVLIESDVYSITTAPTPNAPCPLNNNEITIDGLSQSVPSLTASTWSGYYHLAANNSNGQITFNFKEEPKSGIYKSVQYESDVLSDDGNNVYVKAIYYNEWNCYRYPPAFEYFYIHNNNGVIDIEFCDIVFYPQGCLCFSPTPVYGKFSM